jgi:5-(carboxyamino)imidazole ribonucleotide synthase
MDACITSQFEQTIRAVVGLPLGNPSRLCNAKMLNLIGDDVNAWQTHASTPNAKLHLYGKSEARAGRKMGHVNFLGTN